MQSLEERVGPLHLGTLYHSEESRIPAHDLEDGFVGHAARGNLVKLGDRKSKGTGWKDNGEVGEKKTDGDRNDRQAEQRELEETCKKERAQDLNEERIEQLPGQIGSQRCGMELDELG